MYLSEWQNNSFSNHLNKNEIHVWLLDIFKISKSENDFDNILNFEEKERKNKYYFLKDKITFSTVRGILKLLLSNYLNKNVNQIILKFNNYGKPFLDDTLNDKLKFNISHSKDYGIIVFNYFDDIGIDIEFIKSDLVTQDIASNYFSEYERNSLFELSKDEQQKTFFDIWTRKEAYIKAKGMGLSIPLNSFDVDTNSNNPRIIRSEFELDAKNWHLYNLLISEEYRSAIANFGSKKNIKKYYITEKF